jgi:ElaB/YqjD/DUF883 family membrane-anchored ribosome-binding protein
MAVRKTGERRSRAPKKPQGDARGADLQTAIPHLAQAAERVFHDSLDRFRGKGSDAADAASARLENARLYVIDRVQERPFTTTLAALGAGFLIGLLFAGRRK